MHKRKELYPVNNFSTQWFCLEVIRQIFNNDKNTKGTDEEYHLNATDHIPIFVHKYNGNMIVYDCNNKHCSA